MTPILENAVLANDLDCQNYDIRNVSLLDPVPDGLVGIDDPRLTGGRTPTPGSVTDDSVNATAAIDQSKLSLNGVMPSPWLTDGLVFISDAPVAARGSKAEFLSRKGAHNGYAALDAGGKIPLAHFTPGDAVGSISSIGITIRPPLHVTPAQITNSGTFVFTWDHPSTHAWFGSDGTFDPQHHEFIYPFFVTQAFNAGMFSLPCSKFTGGKFPYRFFPVALGKGVPPVPPSTSRKGYVPNPGSTGATNYLGRDMLWHHFVVTNPAAAKQPHVPDVTIVLDWWEKHDPTDDDPSLVKAHVTIRSLLKDSRLFYRVTPQHVIHPDDFQEALYDKTPDDPHITLEVNEFEFIEAYAAKQGYNNSDIEEWTVMTPISDLTPNPLP
jgi:hypothetical protein